MQQRTKIFKQHIDTDLGQMIVISDEKKLFLLEFADKKNLNEEILTLENEFNCKVEEKITKISKKIDKEIKLYFKGELKEFETPFLMRGTKFQKLVWSELLKIPYGKTISYKELATRIGNDKASRAVANANAKNKIVVLIPCHRIINTNKGLGGYSCGIEKKQKLLALENQKNK
ncbi:methylated-DNA--[protein]-cysteine S-methyltransferase [Mesoplasma tabanidae]|uniref:methylated-DNA--[protein]-cysteine S-methyltransferase n=1 Tax=Mesoplasma tabanidae TaxID=219745 RepID=A0A2K8P4E2_9MOLU|nr:methylated-DNA--[protein]-cysteine S-methyltransferase [Mesoplasma tabanidae]ATZ21622.1 cysteine methyltransferase [Mesoplasma tabanidae]